MPSSTRRSSATSGLSWSGVPWSFRRCTRAVTDPDEKRRALDATVDHAVPGRSTDARPADEAELQGTHVIALTIEEASAKIRTGGPVDTPADYGLDVWAGVIPLTMTAEEPIPDEKGQSSVAMPGYVARYRRPSRS